jgi:hypothetical protein
MEIFILVAVLVAAFFTIKRFLEVGQQIQKLQRENQFLAEKIDKFDVGFNEITDNFYKKIKDFGKEFNDFRLEFYKFREQQPTPAPDDAFGISESSSNSSEQDIPILDLPLSQLISIYHEAPQVLQAYALPASLSEATVLTPNQKPTVLERNSMGGYWVIRLKGGQDVLMPRPISSAKRRALSSLELLYKITGPKHSETAEFTLVQPAKLQTLWRRQRWQLQAQGELLFGEVPERFKWQDQLRQIIADQAQLHEQYQHMQILLTALEIRMIS